ncbi:MAG: glutamine--fructose-6-phosphate transaminase (isomerizing) [Burkholderiaceae bacterium]|jgi:glucosamine--fructose-6-phosphate aminotransferase (isomerizing)|nr:glutamine--fructose-6-phosphate transaminase (isomerizing) [Burkholderiaceae bacterium]
MCGIVGAVAGRDVVAVLVAGLRRLEYRGYDSCGVAVSAASARLVRVRGIARVADLAAQCERENLQGRTGIAHTRWATHGAPAVDNAHPHISMGPQGQAPAGADERECARLTLVHNGIIENHEVLRRRLQESGYVFASQTDTEVIVHLIDSLYRGDLLQAVQAAVRELHGSFAIAVLHRDEPQRLVGARQGSPLVIGVGAGGRERFLASDALALAGVTDQIVYLEDGDVADLHLGRHAVLDAAGQPAQRLVQTVRVGDGPVDLGPYRHYMHKEIFEQPRAVADTLEGVQGAAPELFEAVARFAPGEGARTIFGHVNQVLILACGTSYYAGCVARDWLEALARLPARVEIASEFRYRSPVPDPQTLVVAVSQSGETADTLAALRHARQLDMRHTLAICNVPTSALVRECKLAYLTRAGAEIGVASTKAFTTQLVGLFLLTLALARARGALEQNGEASYLRQLRHLPAALQAVLALEPQIIGWAEQFAGKENALFLGRGLHYPIAQEGALKLKEISYIHAEAYAAGELKHGPLALVTRDMPVVTVAPNDALLEKLKSNMQEVRARGGVLYVLADTDTRIASAPGLHVIRMPEHYGLLSPILHAVPLQLLAYHTAVARGTDVDKPRNLAKSVTVE